MDWCLRQGVPVLPGVATPTEIMAVLERGVKIVKFFSTEALGGIATLKAFSAPFGGVKFMPTGGVSAANLPDYLALPAVHACGGTWMVESKLIAAGQFAEITQLTAAARAIVRQVHGAWFSFVGIVSLPAARFPLAVKMC